MLMAQRKRGFLVRDGNIHAAASSGGKTPQGGFETGGIRIDGLVADIFAGLLGKYLMDDWRPAMADRVPDHCISIPSSCCHRWTGIPFAYDWCR
jgi:hypothetical protein